MMVSPEEHPHEISQDEELELWMLVSHVRKELLMASDRDLRRFSVSTVQLGILYALNNAYEAGISPSLGDLSRWVMRQHNTVSVILNGMERRGLVEVERNQEDKRSVRIHITEKGRELYHDARMKSKAIKQILGSLPPEERQQLSTLLRKLDQKARDILFQVPFP